MIFDELIIDRKQSDVVNGTKKGYIDYEDLNRVETACAELAKLFRISIQTKTDWKMTDFRVDSEMQRIKRNIDALRTSFYVKPDTPLTPSVIRYQTYIEANEIEKILLDLYELYESIDRGTHTLSFKLGAKQIGDRL